jgi:hypothetical protein
VYRLHSPVIYHMNMSACRETNNHSAGEEIPAPLPVKPIRIRSNSHDCEWKSRPAAYCPMTPGSV